MELEEVILAQWRDQAGMSTHGSGGVSSQLRPWVATTRRMQERGVELISAIGLRMRLVGDEDGVGGGRG